MKIHKTNITTTKALSFYRLKQLSETTTDFLLSSGIAVAHHARGEEHFDIAGLKAIIKCAKKERMQLALIQELKALLVSLQEAGIDEVTF